MKKSLRRLSALILILASLVSLTSFAAALASCDSSREPETTEGPESSQESDSEPYTAPPDIVLFDGGKTEYTLIRPDSAEAGVTAAAGQLYDALCKLESSGAVDYYTDFVHSAAPITAHEILVGDTERIESILVYTELRSLERDCFTVREIGEKIVIAGTSPTMISLAVKYFISTYLTGSGDKVTVALGEEYTEYFDLDQPADVLDLLGDGVTGSVTKLGSLAKDGDFKVSQGGCTDGKYIYIVLENRVMGILSDYKQESHYCKIYKLDAVTLETVKVSEPLLIDHGNDCTYNPDTNEIAVVHYAPNGKAISYIDADTLELKRTVSDNTYAMYSIAYSAAYKKYVVGIYMTYDHAVISADGTAKRYSGISTGNGRQGMDCDGKYIYFIQYKENVIVVYDWDGNYIRTVALTNLSDEPESIFFIGSQLYMTSYRGGSTGGANIYRIDLISGS